jgi:nicotinamide mononucleotide transporter
MNNILFEFLGYKMSFLELTATITGLASVWLAARSNILTWFFALVNAVLFFMLFYQVNLYSAMALQVFFFCNACFGWYNWRRDRSGEKKPVSLMAHKQRILWLAVIMAGAIALGTVMRHIHTWLPVLFPQKATFVYTDAMIAVMSIAASLLLAKLKFENWILWILINMMSVAMYAMRGVMLVSIQYVIFLGMATYGLIEWKNAVGDLKVKARKVKG